MADYSKLVAGEGEEANARLLAETATQLVESAERLERTSRLLPTDEDFHFYSNFIEFREPVQGVEARVHEVLSQFSSLRALSRAPSLPSDPDDLSDWLVSMQDELLEQVDSAFDLFKKERAQQGLPPPENDSFIYQNTRKKRRCDVPMKETKPLGGKAVSMQAEKCPVPFHVWSIPRPQDKFDALVDNSNTPFRHPRPLSSSLQDAQPDVATHPLQVELQNMTFEDVLVGVAEPKQPASLEETPFTFVNTPSLLEDTVAKLALEREIAVDLEHHQFRSYQGLTCLMQISTRLEDFVIDTLELWSIIGRHLYDIFASPTIQKVMHGAGLDVMWLQRDFGIYVCNLFDTGQAARVLELESFGLAHLLTRFCGFTPDKRYQMADWRLRPLPVEMMKYAREDTHYLLYIGDLLKQKLLSLQSRNQQEPLLEVFKRSRDICLKLYEKEITTETSYLQVYGLEERKFNSQQLAVLSGLYSWRDQIARVEDESTGYVLPNYLLLSLAEEMPEDVKKLRTMLNGRHTVVGRNSATIVNIIKKMKSSSQRPVTEGRPSLEARTNKSPPLFEEVAFSEESPVTAVVEEERNNVLLPEKGSNFIADNPELQDSSLGQCSNGIPAASITDAATKAAKGLINVADAVLNRATESSLFRTQKVRDKDLDRLEVPKNINCTEVAAGGGKSPELSTLGPASGVVVKRASRSSFVLKAKKINRVIQEVPDASAAVAIDGPLEVASTDCQETSTHGREVDNLASMLGNRASLQLEVRGSIGSEDFEQAEAKSRAERIRASFSLPFHTFDGGNSSAQGHAKVTAEQVFDEDKVTESNLQETEDLILFEADSSEGFLDEKAGRTPYIVSKGIGTTSDGAQHRLWWSDRLGSAQEPSLDTREEEPCDTSNSSSLQTELPVPLSQRFRNQRGDMEYKPQFSHVRTTSANDLGHEVHQSYEHKNQTQEGMASVTSFDYAAAKKNMGLFGGRSGTFEQAEGSNPAQFKEVGRRESTERIFDPQRRVKEFKPEGITPGKRRQVFPQSGNRTGVFK